MDKIPGGIKHYMSWLRSQTHINFSKWNSKKIAFVGVLIAISVVFFIISVRIVPISALPSFKFSFIGLPVKITGFLFGPFIGAITGILADLISFALVPTYYNVLYTLAVAIAGIIPGLILWYFSNLGGLLFNSRYKIYKYKEIISFYNKKYNEALNAGDFVLLQNYSEKIAKQEVDLIVIESKNKPTSLINFSYISTLIILCIQILIIIVTLLNIPDSVFQNNRFIKNKWFYIILTTSGFVTMILSVTIYRLVLRRKYQRFMDMMAIVTFCGILEFTNVILLSWGDYQSLKTDFWINITSHTLLSPAKMWFNLIVIFTAYRIISPLINTKTVTGY
ncbi:ECF transporter S component [Mycoplasma miroungirhinis]|uniref:ECF transporter S component n=1 Tax=Mycoplasma miroungirhinis TaxID=754516 RepID=A0A6M4JD83_9MOLU|nr:ECF transporter S component [Mycoplasma miroungirhinis]QJR44037.1 ECF transporter S component [Mycoplasma miroungirhinis]